MRGNKDAMIYRRQIIEMANDTKKFLTIPASIIQHAPNDMELGNIIRTMYFERCKEADKHIDYIKSLEN